MVFEFLQYEDDDSPPYSGITGTLTRLAPTLEVIMYDDKFERFRFGKGFDDLKRCADYLCERHKLSFNVAAQIVNQQFRDHLRRESRIRDHVKRKTQEAIAREKGSATSDIGDNPENLS